MKAEISSIEVLNDDMVSIKDMFVVIKIDLEGHKEAIEVTGKGYTEACIRAVTVLNAFNQTTP